MSLNIYDTLRDKPLSALTSDEMSTALDLATRIIRADYGADVEGIGESIIDAIKVGEVTDSDSLHERIAYEVVGTQRVIYTYQAKLGLLASDNEDAYDEESGEEGGTPEQRIYYAMCRDVREWLKDLHDIGDDWDGPEIGEDDEDTNDDSEGIEGSETV
jgi:hypothetical protein